MNIIDKDNHGAFDEHISDDNDGNDEASFDSGESAHKYLAGAPLFLCCFIDMIWQANNPVTTASMTCYGLYTRNKYTKKQYTNAQRNNTRHKYAKETIHKYNSTNKLIQ